jgi:formylglycine-generating enzyme required for sulfatase activity
MQTLNLRIATSLILLGSVLVPHLGASNVHAQTGSIPCAAGKVKNRATHGHCCWPGQSWSRSRLLCVGRAECPSEHIRSDDGMDCLRSKCTGGRVDAQGRCCFVGQSWSKERNRCVGAPQCPRGHAARGFECLPMSQIKKGEPLSYQPVAKGDYILLEPGVYTRGSPRREPGRYSNESAHTVAMTRKVLFKTNEVTQREWLALIPYNPSLFVECGLDCPVERVNWYETLEWLNRQSLAEGLAPCYTFTQCTGDLGGGCRVAGEGPRTCTGDFQCEGVNFKGLDCVGYRLPTEAEWEYAVRAGTNTSTYAGNLTLTAAKDAFILEPIAWYRRNAQVEHLSGQACSSKLTNSKFDTRCGTHPVSKKVPTDWGHADLLGNVMEWVWDGYALYPKRSAVNPISSLGIERVVRGGSWATESRFLRAALRSRVGPRGRNAEIGFRAARTISGSTPPTKEPMVPTTMPPIQLKVLPDAAVAPAIKRPEGTHIRFEKSVRDAGVDAGSKPSIGKKRIKKKAVRMPRGVKLKVSPEQEQ